MAYTQDEKSTGLDVLTTLASTDLHIVGDVSDAGRAKAITEDDLEVTIANSTNFVTTLIANTTFTTALAGDTNFINTLTNNATFQTNVNNFVSLIGGGGGTKLAIDTTEVILTGTLTETVLFSIPIPAGTLGTNNAIRFKLVGSNGSFAGANMTLRAKYGGTTFGTLVTNAASGDMDIEGVVIADGATNAQKGNFVAEMDGSAAGLVDYGTAAEDSTGTLNLIITGQLGNTGDSFTAEAIIVEKISSGSGAISTYITTPIAPNTGGAGAPRNFNDNTLMRIGLINIPKEITINSISAMIDSFSAAGTVSYALYSEDGQTLLFDELSNSVSGTGLDTASITPITISPGNYYLGVHSNSTADFTIRCVPIDNLATLGTPTGKAVLAGTVAISASTTPATIDPTTDITYGGTDTILVRFDA